MDPFIHLVKWDDMKEHYYTLCGKWETTERTHNNLPWKGVNYHFLDKDSDYGNQEVEDLLAKRESRCPECMDVLPVILLND